MTALMQSNIEQAKDMYLCGISPLDISRELGIPVNELTRFIYGASQTGTEDSCWYMIRKKNPSPMTSFVKAKRFVLSYTEAKLTQKISESIDGLDIENFSDAKIATDMLKTIDNINRLERGEATENINVDHGVTLRDIKNGSPIIINKEDSDDREEGNEEEIDYTPYEPIRKQSPPESHDREAPSRGFPYNRLPRAPEGD